MSLLKLKNELKVNEKSVPTVLGGRQHGYLGLFLTDVEYKSVAQGTPYLRPTLPQLTMETGDTQFQLAQKRHQYKMTTLTYRESIAVDRILIEQIVNAMDETFLKALRDRHTNRIIMNIVDILIYLFDTYGDISPQELATLRERIEKMDFDPKEPVDEIFTEIDNYAKIATIVDDPMTSTQKCKIAYIVLSNTKKSEGDLKNGTKKIANTKLGKTSKDTSATFNDNYEERAT